MNRDSKPWWHRRLKPSTHAALVLVGAVLVLLGVVLPERIGAWLLAIPIVLVVGFMLADLLRRSRTRRS
jgi:hypothetical protein